MYYLCGRDNFGGCDGQIERKNAMRQKQLNFIVLLVVVISVLCSAAGCASVQAKNLMDGIVAENVKKKENMDDCNAAVTDFALRVFKESIKADENTLVSPLSVLCAISMTANGADGETLKQMEKVLGMSVSELNLYIYSYMEGLPMAEKYKLKSANSIWFTDAARFTVNHDFLQANADYYGVDIYKAPFNDATLKDINNWVSLKTDEMINDILDEIPDDAVMYLVNALAFEAEWNDIYLKTQVNEGIFTAEDKSEKKVEFMHSMENIYLEDENATGFMKYYKDRKYAFVALLPNEEVSISDYLSTMTGEKLAHMLENYDYATVSTAIPKFETEYSIEMSDILKNMGMQDAFDMDKADFTKLGKSAAGNIYINRVLHKTFITVGEKGTKAGAVTVVEMADGALECNPKEIRLDRPFIYMIIDCENNIPFFMGTIKNFD